MSNATPSRLGQALATGDAKALFLKVFAGEVLAAFAEVNVMLGRHMVRAIQSGKSAQFPATWKGTASYHTVGAEILGGSIEHNEKVINIDDLLISPVFIANIDEAMNHYDVRSIYSAECGMALSNTFDKNVLQVGVLAARATSNFDNLGFGGTKITDANFKSATLATKAEALAEGIYKAAETLDTKDVPDAERYAVLRPAEYYALVQSAKAINRDFGGRGSYAEGNVMVIAGVEVVKSNHLPSTLVNTGPTAYQGDFTQTIGLVMHKSAVATVKLIDLAIESSYDIRRQGTLIVAKYAVGHGILRPESAVEFDDTV
jgi:hypothetical protein